MELFVIIPLVAVLVVFLIVVACSANRAYNTNPFSFPQLRINIDISNKRRKNYSEFVDNWLIEMQGTSCRELFEQEYSKWYYAGERKINNSLFFKKQLRKVFKSVSDEALSPDYIGIIFEFTRNQTRYRQHNYVRTPYTVAVVEKTLGLTVNTVEEREEALRSIDYEMPLSKYLQKKQRQLMTKDLRQKIVLRDNFTCQICGKYMPDEVGLHIDHIVPLSRGGKTVESNLQILCDKCNFKKGARK